MDSDPPQETAGLRANPVQAVKWLEVQEAGQRRSHAAAFFDWLLQEAGQPRSVSGQACVRLCGLVEKASKADAEELRSWALSRAVALQLFNFFLDWNESDRHRSMKLVLDLITRFLKTNPDRDDAAGTKRCLLDILTSSLTGRSTKPVAKSAIKALDHFLAKRVVTLGDIRSSYVGHRQELSQSNDHNEIWRRFMVDLFHWMRLHFVCPTAGRLIVCVYRCWRQGNDHDAAVPSMETWYQWLLDFASQEPSLLESIKNYVFLPLFKADRVEGLRLLGKMNEEKAVSTASHLDLDIPALLQLAALETGKKLGLVEEPELGGDGGQTSEGSSITVHEKILDSVLAHPSHEVRALALSLLVTFPSTTRPYSSTALALLRKHLSAFFADPDAKFRVEISGKLRDMFRRVRGAIHVLKRSIPRARAKAQKANHPSAESQAKRDASAVSPPILYRSNLILLPEAQLAHCLEYHEVFLRWYIGFLCSELTPTASYQRHIASLKALAFILRMEGEDGKTWETDDDQQLFFNLFCDKWARALFDLLMDPFEDVRDASASALQKLFADQRYRRFALSGHEGAGRITETLTEVSRRAEDLAQRTARADHSDGASRASQLLYQFLDSGEKRVSFLTRLISELERKASVAESDLGRAVLVAPLHGDFASLSHIWRVASEVRLSGPEMETVEPFQCRLVSCCERVWEAVRGVLCDDSPEGNLPQELEEVEGLDTRDLLSFSFRAIHESSNLMQTMVLTTRNRVRDGFISPDQDLFRRIGNLTFNQLAALRHRGAFTTVALTFATCCQQTKHSDQERALLETWYQGTMDAIFSQASTTRRSAGIPSMMTGILSANAPHPSFAHVMERLMSIAGKEVRVSETDGSNLPQVHAYNCLKDIFKNSMLTSMGNKSEQYLPRCLELAASGLRSEVWAIRNCGLIFLRSLIDCLFGSQESKAMIEMGWNGKANRIPYHRYPNLPAVLRNLLESGHQTLAQSAATAAAAESVFPALDIIRRAGPPELLRDEIQDHVAVYLSSPVWHVRELAARTLCSCLLHERWLQTVEGLFQDALLSRGRNSHNHVHGVLLTLKFVIERLGEVAVDRLAASLARLARFLAQSPIYSKFPYCPDIAAAHLEVLNRIWAFEKAHARRLSPFRVVMAPSSGSALLGNQKAIHNVYAASVGDRPVERLRALLLGRNVGGDGLVTALETLPRLWDAKSTSEQTLSELCALYTDVCLGTGLADAQLVAMQNLAHMLDQLLQRDRLDEGLSGSLAELWAALAVRPMSPDLSNAVIRASGCIVAAFGTCRGTRPAVDLPNWGRMMSEAGLDDKGFDTRLAAAESLRSFFAVAGPCCGSEDHLPALVALYDALNDDDDEVRDVGGAAVTSIVGEALVPIEAADRLLRWLAQHLGGGDSSSSSSPGFRAEVASRMVGHSGARAIDGAAWEPAEQGLAQALEFDDSLFVVEEQNLFVDEVREARRWAGVFENLAWDAGDETLARLDGWLRGGLAALGRLSAREDGPLGWASNPDVFALFSRIIRSSVAVARQHGSAALCEAVRETRGALRSPRARVSRFVTEAWEDE